jgi:hypothetical protein
MQFEAKKICQVTKMLKKLSVTRKITWNIQLKNDGKLIKPRHFS